jgi:hypothetical protein
MNSVSRNFQILIWHHKREMQLANHQISVAEFLQGQ